MIWFGYARHISSAGGLYSFTEAAAGRRVALAQAGLWALSYLLYLRVHHGADRLRHAARGAARRDPLPDAA